MASIGIGCDAGTDKTYRNSLIEEHFYKTSPSANDGFVLALQIKPKTVTYNHGVLKFDYCCGANAQGFGTGTIVVRGGASNDPSLVAYCSNPAMPFFIHKSSTNTWNVYIGKVGSEQVGIYNLQGFHPELYTVTTQNSQVTALPSGYIRASWDNLDAVYPVGAIRITTDANNPGTIFGGTWTKIEDRVLVGASSTYAVNATGGSNTIRLAQNQLPSITGDITMHSASTGTNIHAVGGVFSGSTETKNKYRNGGTEVTGANSIAIIKFNNGGSGAAIDIRQPYYAVYIWRRTA